VTKWSVTFLLGIVIGFLEALFSPGHEFIACMFSLPQAAAFSKSIYHIGINEMLMRGGHTCDQSW